MKLILLISLLFSNFFNYCQTLNRQSVEVSSQLRREKQADYTTRFGTVSYQNTLRLYGTSIRVDVGYKRFLNGHWFVRPSVGFYSFAVDRIANNRIPAQPNDPTSYRPINYRPDSLPLGYSTSKYHYDNLALGFAFGKVFHLDKSLLLTTEMTFTYLQTFSQHYRVGKSYTTTNSKSLGYLLDYWVGIQKEIKNFYLTTNIILPLYKEWKQDEVFLENPNNKVDTWFGGYGVALTIGKHLK